MEANIMNMCMIKDGNKVLVQDRIKSSWPGIAFPGGKMELNEGIAEAVIREVREETGLTVSNLKFRGFKNWTNDDNVVEIIFLFEANQFEGDLIDECHEGVNKWVLLSELSELNLAKGFKNDLDIYLSNDIVETFYRSNEETGEKWIKNTYLFKGE